MAATQIGMELKLIKPATGAGLVAAGLLSVMIFPLVASTLLERRKRAGMAHGGEEPERAAGPLCTSAM